MLSGLCIPSHCNWQYGSATVDYILGATQTSPLDSQDEVAVRNIIARKRLVEEEIDLCGLEFINSETDGLDRCHPSTWNDRLARLLEVCEVPTSYSLRGTTISPCSMEAESEEGEEFSPPRVMAPFSPLPTPPILATSGDLPAEGTPVVKVPGQKSIISMLWKPDLGLIEHLRECMGTERSYSSTPWNPLKEVKAICVLFLHVGDRVFI